MRFGARVLFRDVSFELVGGESLAVTGPNGSGKSTLLRILAGVLRPARGRVRLRYGERAVRDEERPLCTGMVAPYLNVYDGFSARENLAFIARARRLEEGASRIEAMLELVGLRDRADELVQTYSSGMRQRVKVAAALLARPPVLLLDEPTTNLDAAGVQMVSEVAARHTRDGGVLVVATNVAEEAAACDRTIRVDAA